MIDNRTHSLIAAYMQWTNRKILTPEEFLLFRKQAIEEELNGLPEPSGALQPGLPPKGDTVGYRNTSSFSELSASRNENQGEKRKNPTSASPVVPTHPFSDNKEERRETSLKGENNTKKESNEFGMSDGDFLAFMQSIDD